MPSWRILRQSHGERERRRCRQDTVPDAEPFPTRGMRESVRSTGPRCDRTQPRDHRANGLAAAGKWRGGAHPNHASSSGREPCPGPFPMTKMRWRSLCSTPQARATQARGYSLAVPPAPCLPSARVIASSGVNATCPGPGKRYLGPSSTSTPPRLSTMYTVLSPMSKPPGHSRTVSCAKTCETKVLDPVDLCLDCSLRLHLSKAEHPVSPLLFALSGLLLCLEEHGDVEFDPGVVALVARRANEFCGDCLVDDRPPGEVWWRIGKASTDGRELGGKLILELRLT
ncbi:hypothetical protein BD413DRAFT_229851 [Trametes elegans]|nr:hypothetical protein BD413DRAFT_229851 [Trametes elegans]